MKMGLNFCGAARNVTGSSYVLDANGGRFVVDCGMYQERDLRKRNFEPYPVAAASIDAALLTHAHLDHCGRLPCLIKEGFSGPIFCTSATGDIAEIILRDSAKIQMEDLKRKRRRHEREGREGPFPYEPMYTIEDVEETIGLFKPVRYGSPVKLGNGVSAIFTEAGHILGSASIKVTAEENGESRSVVFSGDLGQWDTPIIRDPEPFEDADYVLIESTYGNRLHKSNEHIPDQLESIINHVVQGGGNIVIPSFSVERAQELLYHLNELVSGQRIPRIPVFVDSPMAIRVTEVFRRHPELFDEETMALLHSGNHPCDFEGLKMCRTVDESKAINNEAGSAIIIAGSGMCTGGRVKHHLKHNVGRPESIVLFVGYQAVGTLGRRILEGDSPIRIHGQEFEMRCRVEKVNGFSAHGDRNELHRWLSALKRPPRRVFVTHGEERSAESFGEYIGEETGWPVTVATYLEPVELD
jgi:metallo-beta-lactamase family protein